MACDLSNSIKFMYRLKVLFKLKSSTCRLVAKKISYNDYGMHDVKLFYSHIRMFYA